jgi:hypothetical protein
MTESKRTDVVGLVVDILQEYPIEKLQRQAREKGLRLPESATKEQIMVAIAEEHLRSGERVADDHICKPFPYGSFCPECGGPTK